VVEFGLPPSQAPPRDPVVDRVAVEMAARGSARTPRPPPGDVGGEAA